MYKSSTETRKSRKAFGLLAALGVCVAAVATFIGTYGAPQSVFGDEALKEYELVVLDG
jgi:hypothetical protein